MRNPTGEMPFLDHLEEFRLRILRSLAALVVGFGFGLWVVQRLQLISLLKTPIAPFLPDGKLVVLSPTDPIMIVLKLSFVVGLVLASPVIIWQTWAFLSPALYEREKKAMVPALFVGLGLFLTGSALAWFLVVPQALAILLSFQAEAFNTLITYEKYFGFVLQIVLAMGISFELPLLLVILTALGITTPATLGRFRRIAVILAFIAGAVLSPGADVFSMVMMTLPLLLLYEVGLAGSVVVHRRRLRREAAAAAALGVWLLLAPGTAGAQAPPPRPGPPPAVQDTTRPAGRLDSAAARRMGLPSAPSRSFPAPDSVMAALLERAGFLGTRFIADTATVAGADRRLRLGGNAMTERAGTILEAGAISYVETGCELVATGDPRLFDQGTVMVGGRIRYDTCLERGVVDDALTSFAETGTNWFIRGNLAADSSSSRLFAAGSEITSCDLPVPHYHFAAKEVKWVSKSVIVARPAVLYIRDVPIAWLPFIFQETKPGRRSGILVPQFGFNDIVRPDPGYERQVTDFGYYWAINDYLDAQVRFDWYSNRYFRYTVAGQYRWLNRFVDGAVEYSRQLEDGGSSATSLRWSHRQAFSITTNLNFNVNLSSNTRVLNNNAIDPFLNTQQLASDLNLTKRFTWGTVTLGGRRRQTLGDDQISQTLPSLAITPKPFDLGQWGTWSPTMNFTNDLNAQSKSFLLLERPGGGVDSVELTPRTRTTLFNLDTPLRFGSFTWRNSVVTRDVEETRPTTVTVRIPDETTPDPTDSIAVIRRAANAFQSAIDWQTGINLPLLFRGSWKLTPNVGITNTTQGEFAIRNERTQGAWVTQGKRLTFGLAAAPTLFAFFGGIGPIERIRHSFQPIISWNYAPKAGIPREYAEARSTTGQAPNLTSPATQTLNVSLTQNFEAKERRAPGDTSETALQRKYRILSINTSGLTYDFEQAKLPGRTGWTTATMTNTLLSDLLPGFSLSLTHHLWDGQVGMEGTRFSPFLQNLAASVTITGATFRGIGAIFGLGEPRSATQRAADSAAAPALPPPDPRMGIQQRTLRSSNLLTGARRPFSMNLNLSIDRNRALPGSSVAPPGRSSLRFSTAFSPTRFWGVSWSTQFNITDREFESQVVSLQRDLHDWRAGFNFVRNPNGNFAFYFSIHLIELPDIKADYNQTSITREP